MAQDIHSGKLDGSLRVVWHEAESKEHAKSAQDALISLFRRDFGRPPQNNKRRESHRAPERYEAIYSEIKKLISAA
jgi:hypothetical protein